MKILKTFLQNKLHFQSVHSGNSEMLRKLSLAQNDSRYFAQSLFLLDLLDTIQYYLIIITSIPFVEMILCIKLCMTLKYVQNTCTNVTGNHTAAFIQIEKMT